MKKYPLLFVALVSILVLSFSVIAFAAPVTTEAVKVLQGQFVSIDDIHEHIVITTPTGNETLPFAKLVWVYRDQNAATIADLVMHDEVELILNSKNQVAYIKANSIADEDKDVEQSKTNDEKPVIQVDKKQNEQKDKQQLEVNKEEATSVLETIAVQDDLEQLKIDIQDPNVKIKIDIKPEHPQHPATVKIKTKEHANIHLYGGEAEQFIHQVIGDLTTEKLQQKDGLVEQFVNLFYLNPDKLKVHFIIKANGQTENYHYNDKNNKHKDELKVKDEVKVKNSEKKDVKKEEKKDLKKKEHEDKKEMKKGKQEEKHKKQKQKHKDHKEKKDGEK